MTTGYERFRADAEWFLGRLDAVPKRLHVRGVWADEDGLGSVLGSPALHQSFARWLEASETAYRQERSEVPCPHPGVDDRQRARGQLCMACAVLDSDGRPITETGRLVRVRTIYRWPMRAAMAKLRRVPVRSGRPDFAITLLTFARSNGDLGETASVLARRYPVMADYHTFIAHLSDALRRVKRLHRTDPPVDLRPSRTPVKSEAQLNAEVRSNAQA